MCLPYVIALASNSALAIRYNGVAREDFACPNHSNAARSVKRTITETPGLVRLAERSLSMSRRSHNRKKAFRPGGTTTIVTVRPIYSRDRYTTPHAGFPPVLSSWGSHCFLPLPWHCSASDRDATLPHWPMFHHPLRPRDRACRRSRPGFQRPFPLQLLFRL